MFRRQDPQEVNGYRFEKGADLSGANLAGVNFREAFQGSPKELSNLLAGINLSGANLAGADIHAPWGEGTNFSGANLSGADLSDSWFPHNFSGANLSGANLSNTYLHKANLSGANLRGAQLYAAKVGDFTGADLREANLDKFVCRYEKYVACFRSANLSGVNLAKFVDLNGESSRWIEKYSFEDADLTDCFLPFNFTEPMGDGRSWGVGEVSTSYLTGKIRSLDGVTLLGFPVIGSQDFRGVSMKSCRFAGTFSSCNFSGVDLSGLIIIGDCRFLNCNFIGANLRGMTVADDGSMFLKTNDLLSTNEVFEPVDHSFYTALDRASGKQDWGEPFPTVTWEKCSLENVDLYNSHFELPLNGNSLIRRQRPLDTHDLNTAAMAALGFNRKEKAKVTPTSAIESQLAEVAELLAEGLIEQAEHDALRRKILGI